MPEIIDVKCGSDVTTYQTCEFIAQRYVDACARSTNEAATDSLASLWNAKRDTAQQIANHIRQFRHEAERRVSDVPEESAPRELIDALRRIVPKGCPIVSCHRADCDLCHAAKIVARYGTE